jgi:hypothetical protein
MRWLFFLAVFLTPLLIGAISQAASFTFEEHVLPILKANCFPCHSSGKRKHGLDVRQRQLLLRGGDSGPAIAPGNAAGSRLFQRVSRSEMPPGERKKLSPEEIETIRRWIDEGAKTSGDETPIVEDANDFLTPADREHWAFKPISRPPVPAPNASDRARTPVDAFILEKLKSKGLSFSSDAEPRALLRRAYFDLTGLPPPAEEADELLSDPMPGAYERLVDRLLSSPSYGERWGRHWLDAAGYADSDGYTDADSERPHAWKYRDYVIKSFNDDKPYDVFLTEQIAGDELAGYPGCELTPRNIELLTATGYLRNASDGSGQGNVDPLRARNQVIADTIGILGSGVLGLTVNCAQCHDHRYDPISQRDYHRLRATLEPAYDTSSWKTPDARRISLSTEADRKKAAEVAAAVETKRAERNGKEAELVRAVAEKLISEKIPENERDPARAAFNLPPEKRTSDQKALFEKHPFLKISGGTLYQYDQPAADKVKALDAEIGQLAATRPPEDFVSALWEEPGHAPKSHLFLRGQPDQPAEEVAPGGLAVLFRPAESFQFEPAGNSLKTSGRRLELARWLTRPDHPLTARVIVNRVWMHHFGRGLVATSGDFGTQGEKPSHPELLDWLADEFVRGGWKLKQLHRLIMTSTVYLQSAVKTRPGAEADPENELLWRKPLVRLEGEAIRDAMLATSGVLTRQAGGPAVPVKEDADGSIVVGIDKKAESNRPGPEVPMGADAFRRTVYVQVRRTRPLSFTTAFDAPVMETNCTRRPVSLVAPQALTLLNGSFAREEAQLFAKRLEKEAPDGAARVDLAFRLAFSRPPAPAERENARAFLGAAVEAEALTNFCQVLFNASEFIFID